NALRTAYEIASSSPRIAYMGGATSRGGDLTRSVGFRFTPEGLETLFLRSKALIDMRSANVANPVSGMWGNIEDLEGLRTFAPAASASSTDRFRQPNRWVGNAATRGWCGARRAPR